MPQVSEQDLNAIKEWIAKEPYLPKTFDDFLLEKFIFSCHCSLERTKTCIEQFCTRRANMVEVFTHRDPFEKKLRKMLDITSFWNCINGNGVDEILIHYFTESPSNVPYDFYDYIKCIAIQCDYWMSLKRDTLPENHIIIMDLKYYTLSLVAKTNIFYYQKFILYLLETVPVRLKQIHLINCPPFYEYMFNLVKPVLPENICEMINFHTNHTGLHKFIDKAYLPKDFDGDNISIAEYDAKSMENICDNRKFYLDDNMWKSDLTKKPKTGKEDNSMSGSFRTLAID